MEGTIVRGEYRKASLIPILIVVVLIPLTVAMGMYLLSERRFFITSALVIVEAFTAFGLSFEGKTHPAREVVVLSLLCALAVAGRAIGIWIPNFNPLLAIVILSGVHFGMESGFLVGSMSAFLSNFYLGQSPMTPWQMFAFGLIGFFGGAIFYQKSRRHRRAAFCIYGALSIVLIFSPVLNISSLLMYQENPTAAMAVAYYLQGLPFDAVLAAATAIFLALLAKPMGQRLHRIKVKYGMV